MASKLKLKPKRKLIRLISDGTLMGTDVLDAAGRHIAGIRKVTIVVEQDRLPRAIVEFELATIDLVAHLVDPPDAALPLNA